MKNRLWSQIDEFLGSKTHCDDESMEAVLRACSSAGLPPISVAPNQGKLLNMLARMTGASRILEIGTLGGYSTIWLARALKEGGKVVTLELEKKHAEVAASNFQLSGVTDRVELRLGPAIETLDALAREGVDDFDFVFIDADKQSCATYFSWALDHTRAGGVIVVDNVVREGAVMDAHSSDESALGVRRFFDLLASEPRVDATALQTVGLKGHDGLAIAIVVSK